LHGVTAAVDLAMLEWEEGARRLAALDLTARRRAVVETVAAELEAEIVRRIGQTFDLARLEWEEGARRLAALDLTARRRAVVETVAAELEAEIVRRIGQTFDLA